MANARRMRNVAIALAAACAGCAPLSAGKAHFARATPLCDIVRDEQKFAGQTVTVRALMVNFPHQRAIADPECDGLALLRGSNAAWDKRARRVIEAAQAIDRNPEIPVVVSGIFQPQVRYENGRTIIQSLWGPTIDDARVVAARQPRRD